MNIGDGIIGEDNDGKAEIKMPKEVLIIDAIYPIKTIVESTYPSISLNASNSQIFKSRVILVPTNEMVEKINDHVMSLLRENEVEYLIADIISKVNGVSTRDEEIFSVEFLNSIKRSELLTTCLS